MKEKIVFQFNFIHKKIFILREGHLVLVAGMEIVQISTFIFFTVVPTLLVGNDSLPPLGTNGLLS